MYTEKDLVAVAKRENNTKRKYLVVNKLQGKHIPVDPRKSLAMFTELAQQVKQVYANEKILLIGFAETATAIGSAVAAETGARYIQTTRENIPNTEYLFFSEQHSHATEQKLVKNDIDAVINDIDRIVFVEDEVTTGNTILNIINIIEKIYTAKIKFSVAALINGMDESFAKVYAERGITVHYLVKTRNSEYDEVADKYEINGTYVSADTNKSDISAETITHTGYVNARRLTDGNTYRQACEKLYQQIKGKLDNFSNLLVLGTEETMYPAMYVGARLADDGCNVKNHATTRSPIAVSKDYGYPLHTRYTLKSLYDEKRTTFIYNIGKYDAVVLVTDAENMTDNAINTLLNSISAGGNNIVYIIRWTN
ncbi:MAG: phosphoribosyltransferase domain-containing protein [Oscillospiraceae bacterium]|nr:phosphoribosyltransferase domain-containing protein [Oscillospiraceae bacterium]